MYLDEQETPFQSIGEDFFLFMFRRMEMGIRFIRDDNDQVIRISTRFRQMQKMK